MDGHGLWGAGIRPVPDDLKARRAQFRARRGAFRLIGWRHFAAITTLGALTTAACARLIVRPAWWEWAAIPTGFLIANVVEWAAHRWPLHNPMRPLLVAYERHTLEHHQVYTHSAMEAESAADFDMVLFSLPSLAMFLLGAGLPAALLFFAFVSWNAGWIFVALAVDYYVLYEYFHLAYHLPERSWVGRLPGMARLRRHHTRHHDPRVMNECNFNVTFPICDVLFGTAQAG